jgi:hypothetical protein
LAAVAVAQIFNGVPNANPRSGSPANVVANGFALQRVVNGNDTLENPAGIFSRYGYLTTPPSRATTSRPRPSPTRTPTWSPAAARRPDGRLRLRPPLPHPGPRGLHALGATYNRAYFTRVNLDVKDPSTAVTLLNPLPADATDSGVRSIDGSTYDPFTGQLLFTARRATWAASSASP